MSESKTEVSGLVTDKEYFLNPIAEKLVRELVWRRLMVLAGVLSILGALGFWAVIDNAKESLVNSTESDLEAYRAELKSSTDNFIRELENSAESSSQKYRAELRESMVLEVDTYRTEIVSALVLAQGDAQSAVIEAKSALASVNSVAKDITSEAKEAQDALARAKYVIDNVGTKTGKLANYLANDKVFTEQITEAIRDLKLSNSNWRSPVLAGEWTNYEGSYSKVQFVKDAVGFVRIRGLISNKTLPGTTTVTNQVLFTLPPEYAPTARHIFTVLTHPNVTGRVDISSDGNVTLMQGSPGWVSLEGLEVFVGHQHQHQQ